MIILKLQSINSVPGHYFGGVIHKTTVEINMCLLVTCENAECVHSSVDIQAEGIGSSFEEAAEQAIGKLRTKQVSTNIYTHNTKCGNLVERDSFKYDFSNFTPDKHEGLKQIFSVPSLNLISFIPNEP